MEDDFFYLTRKQKHAWKTGKMVSSSLLVSVAWGVEEVNREWRCCWWVGCWFCVCWWWRVCVWARGLSSMMIYLNDKELRKTLIRRLWTQSPLSAWESQRQLGLATNRGGKKMLTNTPYGEGMSEDEKRHPQPLSLSLSLHSHHPRPTHAARKQAQTWLTCSLYLRTCVRDIKNVKWSTCLTSSNQDLSVSVSTSPKQLTLTTPVPTHRPMMQWCYRLDKKKLN